MGSILDDIYGVKAPKPLETPADIAGPGESLKSVRLAQTEPEPAVTSQPSTLEDGLIKTQQPQQQMSYVEMFEKMYPNKPLTPEEIEAEKQRKKRTSTMAAIGDAISAFANLASTSQGGFNAYNPANTLSAKTRAYWDKLDKDRDANSARYYQMYQQATAADRGEGKARQQMELTLKDYENKQADRAFNREMAKKKAENDIAALERQQQKDAWERDYKERSLAESARQFDVKSQQEAQQLKLTASKLAREWAKDNPTIEITLGRGNGNVKVPKNNLNDANIAAVFNRLREEDRAKVHGKLLKAPQFSNEEPIYAEPDSDAMLTAIGAYIGYSPEAQIMLKEVASGKGIPDPNDNTPPSMRQNQENTPPSKR